MISFSASLKAAEAALGIDVDGLHLFNPVAYGFINNHQNEPGQNPNTLILILYAIKMQWTVGQLLPFFGEHLDDGEGSKHPNIRALKACNQSDLVENVVSIYGEPILLYRLAQERIDVAWESRAEISAINAPEVRDAVEQVIKDLNAGRLRVAEQRGVGDWQVNQWVKKAVLLSFRLNDNRLMRAGELEFFDKVRLKFAGLNQDAMRALGLRVVPPAVARHGSYIAPGVVLMPSYVNIGAYVGENTMVDTWATVGSCAQIGKNVHLSGGVGIGGVLEPPQANPTIIEDNCFIGARSEVVEGVIVEENSVISMGVYIGQSTKIYHRATGTVSYGRIPAGSVVVPGTLPSEDGTHSLYCAVIVKQVDAQTRAKTSINELLRA